MSPLRADRCSSAAIISVIPVFLVSLIHIFLHPVVPSSEQVMDRIQPGVVVWKRVNLAPKNRFKKVENGNYVIEIAKVRIKNVLCRQIDSKLLSPANGRIVFFVSDAGEHAGGKVVVILFVAGCKSAPKQMETQAFALLCNTL